MKTYKAVLPSGKRKKFVVYTLIFIPLMLLLLFTIYVIHEDISWPKTPEDAGYDSEWIIGKTASEIQERYGEFLTPLIDDQGRVRRTTGVYRVRYVDPNWVYFLTPERYRHGNTYLKISFDSDFVATKVFIKESEAIDWM